MRYLTDWEWLMGRVLLLGLTVFIWSFFTEIDGVTELFGDKLVKKYSSLPARLEWGFRHYVYTVTFGIITIIQCVKILKWVEVRGRDNNAFPIRNRIK